MNQTQETINMLNEIYKAASMGVEGTALLVNKTDDVTFSGKLHEYANRYNEIKNEAVTILSEQGQSPRDAGTKEKGALWMGVQMNTLVDKSPSHMAEMLIEGATMGIIKSVKTKNARGQSDQRCTALEDKLLSLQQQHIEDMKTFLM